MNDIFSYDYIGLDKTDGKITICSGPVIIDQQGKILLHISSSTGKYQFIGGRLNDSESLQQNALSRGAEVLGHQDISLLSREPLCIHGEINRNGQVEKLVLFHYLAKLNDESSIGEAEWKTLEEIEDLQSKDMLSSENILIASKHFLEK